MGDYAPICLFVYNREQETIKTIEALKKNFLAKESDLIVFSDGPKNNNVSKDVLELRVFLKSIKGFKSVTIKEAEKNKGLANSIIEGVSLVLDKYGRVIVLEDDLVTTPNFLNFMNQALEFYKNERKIFSISGFTMDLNALKNYEDDFYLGLRASSWGWGTWKDRWNEIDWEVKDYDKFKNNIFLNYKFMKGGSDMPQMLKKQMLNKIDSWAIRWCYHQFKYDLLTVFPAKSKIINIGFGLNATHTRKKQSRFEPKMDNGKQKTFHFKVNLVRNKKLEKDFRGKFSFYSRLKNKF